MINLSTDEASRPATTPIPHEFPLDQRIHRGTHMFDADPVPWSRAATVTCIMQVFGAAGSATTLMITAWGDGHLRSYFNGEPPARS
jgi:hypothetical protein